MPASSPICALLLRYNRRSGAPGLATASEQILEQRAAAINATDIDQLIGYEGSASRAYFQSFPSLLPDDIGFDDRNRRPPKDPVNSALSFGYAVLLGEATSALRRAGLHPSIGFLHTDDGTRASLALDLMEEFRPLIVDTVVIDLFRRSILTRDSFHQADDAVLLSEKGRRTLLGALEERLLTLVMHIPTGSKASYRRAIVLQARQLAKWIEDAELYPYRSQPWR